MATHSDGSIVIDTKVNNSGFKQGSDEMKKAIQSLADQINKTGNQLQSTMNSVVTKVNDLGNKMQTTVSDNNSAVQVGVKSMNDYKKAVTEFANTCAKIDTAESFEEASGILDDLENQLNSFAKTFYDMGNGIEVSGNMTDGYDQMVSALEKLKQAVADAATQASEDSVHTVEDYAEAVMRFTETCKQFDGANSFEEAQAVIANLKQQLDDLANTEFDINGQSVMGNQTTIFEEMARAIANMEEALDKAAHSPEWNAFQEKWKNMATISGMVKNSVASALSGIKTAGASIATVVQHPIQAADRALGAMAVSAKQAVTALAGFTKNAIISGIQRIGNAARNAALNLTGMVKGGIVSGIQKLGSALTGAGRSSGSMGQSMASGLKSMVLYGLGIQSILSILSNLPSSLMESFETMGRYDSQFGTTIQNFKNALEGLKNAFASAFAPVAQVVLPILTSLINALAQAMNYVGGLIAALTGKSSFTKATAVQAGAAKAANSNAKAMGKEAAAAKEAKKQLAGFDDVQILHDDSTSGGGGSPGGADGLGGFENSPIGGSLADLAKLLKDAWAKADFSEIGKMLGEKLRDALKKIPWPKIKAVLRKVAKSIATFLNGFLEVPGLFKTIGETIAEALNSAFEFVASFVSNFHWSSLGQAIKDLLLGELNTIDWTLIYNTFTGLGTGIGKSIETALDNDEIWTAVFTAISNGLNSAISGIHGFLSAIDWGNLASSIGTGLNAGVGAFNWATLADTLIRLINGAFDAWYTFVTTFDFGKFGSHIGTTLSGAIKGINWAEGGSSVAETINGLLSALNGFITDTDWGALGKAVVDVISNFFGEFDWAEAGSFLSNCIQGLYEAITGVFTSIDWTNLPFRIVSAISSFLTGFDWSGTAETVGKYIGSAFKAIIEVGSSLWELMKGVGQNIMDGGFEGIIQALKDVGTWIKTNILDPFISGFKEAFGIASPSTVMKEQGGYIIDGLFAGIIAVIDTVSTWLKTNVFDPFMSAIRTLFGLDGDAPALLSIGKELFGSFKDGLLNGLSGINSWLRGNIVDPFLTAIKTLFGIGGEEPLLLTVGKDLFNSLKTGILNAVEGVSDWLNTNVVEPFMTAFTTLFGITGEESSFAEIGGKLINGFLAGIAAVMLSINEWVQTTITDPFISAIKSLFGLDGEESVLVSVGSNLIEGLKNGLTGAIDGMKEWVETNVTGPIVGFFKDLFGIASPSTVFEEFGGYLIEGLKNGLKAKIEGLKEWLETNITGPICGFFKNLFGIESPSTVFEGYGGYLIEGLKNGLKAKIDGMKEWIETNVTGPICGFFKNLFGIESPSTVFASYGGYLMEGLEGGIEDNTNLPEDALTAANKTMRSAVGAQKQLTSWGVVGSNIMSMGLQAGIQLRTSDVVKAMEKAEGKIRKAVSSQVETWKKQGSELLDNLTQGIKDKNDVLIRTVEDLLKTVGDKLTRYTQDMKKAGTNLIKSLIDGMSAVKSNLQNLSNSMAGGIWKQMSNVNWGTLGHNIGVGIYNGLVRTSSMLQTLAWNIAVRMYNAACRALGIRSPSKEFAWIGEMVTKGLGEGIEDTQDNAVNAVTSLADTVTKEAKDANPIMTLSTEADGLTDKLDTVLTGFSDRIVESFRTLADTLSGIASGSSFTVPAVATGSVTPYASRRAASESRADTLPEVLNAIAQSSADRLTREDLTEILSDAFQKYLNVSLYIGDEQVARHANAGNASLNLRYQTA